MVKPKKSEEQEEAPAVNVMAPKRPVRRLSRRGRLIDTNAPAYPKSGYTLFFMEKRSMIVAQHPTLPPTEHTKICAEHWRALKPEAKQKYLDRSAVAKEKYLKEHEAYKKTDSYKQFKKKQEQTKRNAKTARDDPNDYRVGDVPIFTNEFLHLNKEREAEVRSLRGEVVQLEEERDALQRHIAKMHNATNQLMQQTNSHREVNVSVRRRLEKTRAALVSAFEGKPMPDTGLVPTLSSIDAYMQQLHQLVLNSPSESQKFITEARDIIARLKIPPS